VMGASLWKLPPEDIESQLNASNVAMEKICDLPHEKEQTIKWSVSGLVMLFICIVGVLTV